MQTGQGSEPGRAQLSPPGTDARATETAPAADHETIGPYVVLDRLGSGGMGTVFLGSAPDGRRVAIKVIRPELGDDPAFVARFRAEVDAARRVAGFCTARVLDAGLDPPRPYLVTEYVEGPRLDRAIEQQGPLEGSSLEAFAVGVAAALTSIHSAGIVHRDLKPGNVLLSPFGPRVIDFGIARALDATTALTQTGAVLGTPGWMAPEQLGTGSISPATDVFLWGCLVAYAGTGRPPFGTGPLPALAYRIMKEPADLDGLPPGLARLVAAATDKDPSRRPSARQLLLELVGDVDHDPQAAATTVLRRTWPRTAAWRGSAGPPPASAAPAVPPRSTVAGPSRRSRRRSALVAVLALVVIVAVVGLAAYLRQPTSGAGLAASSTTGADSGAAGKRLYGTGYSFTIPAGWTQTTVAGFSTQPTPGGSTTSDSGATPEFALKGPTADGHNSGLAIAAGQLSGADFLGPSYALEQARNQAVTSGQLEGLGDTHETTFAGAKAAYVEGSLKGKLGTRARLLLVVHLDRGYVFLLAGAPTVVDAHPGVLDQIATSWAWT